MLLYISQITMQCKCNFYMHWEAKNSCDFLYSDVHFIAVMWKQTQCFRDMPVVDCKSHYPKVLL